MLSYMLSSGAFVLSRGKSRSMICATNPKMNRKRNTRYPMVKQMGSTMRGVRTPASFPTVCVDPTPLVLNCVEQDSISRGWQYDHSIRTPNRRKKTDTSTTLLVKVPSSRKLQLMTIHPPCSPRMRPPHFLESMSAPARKAAGSSTLCTTNRLNILQWEPINTSGTSTIRDLSITFITVARLHSINVTFILPSLNS